MAEQLPICEKLRSTIPTFGHIKQMGDTKYRVNPDGPEAADTITALYEALAELLSFGVEPIMVPGEPCKEGFKEAKSRAFAALKQARGEA